MSHCVTNFIPVKFKKKTLKNNPWTTGEVMHAKHQLERIRKENKVTGTNPSNASRLALAKNFKEKSKAKHHYFNTVLTSFLKNNPYILEPLPPRKHSQLSFRPIKKKKIKPMDTTNSSVRSSLSLH